METNNKNLGTMEGTAITTSPVQVDMFVKMKKTRTQY